MSRSNWKGPFIERSLLKKDFKTNKDLKINTWSRKSTILPFLIETQVNVHNGKKFINLKITEEMLGHKLGEFIPTRASYFYKKIKDN